MTKETKENEIVELKTEEVVAASEVEETIAADVVSTVEETPVAEEESFDEVVPVAEETMTEAQMELAQVAVIKKGDSVIGKIVKIDEDQAFVDIGYKYDGLIPVRELSSLLIDNAADAVVIGREVQLKVVMIDDNKEKLILSKRVVDSVKAWQDLQEKLDSKETFEAKVTDVVKGGLVVDVGVRAFIPASMVERHFVEDFSDYKGRTLKLRVKELDQEKNKVILSQKDVLDEEFEANKKNIMTNLQIGQELDGTVQRLTPFGAFIDIGGIDGLAHISEMAWHHVDHPSEVVKEGDSVRVQVLKLDPQNDRISLSLRATQPGPWQKISDEIIVGSIITGTVQRLTNFGAFVEVAPGVEGLVHISQIAHKHIATPQEVLSEGQEVSVKVLDVNPTEKRISLSIKDTEEGPEVPVAQDRGSKPDSRDKRGTNSNNKGDRPRGDRKPPKSDYVQAENAKLTHSLGDLFGDKLNKFK